MSVAGLDQAVFLYVDESIRQCKELAAFVKKKQAADAEYAKTLLKLASASQKASAKATAGMGGYLQNEKGDIARAMVLKSSVWKAFSETLANCENTAHALLSKSKSVSSEVVSPFATYIKEMEQHLDRIQVYTRNVEEVCNALKKAKKDLDLCQNQTVEHSSNYSKTQANPAAKERDLEKLAARVNSSVEKTLKAQETVKYYDEVCSQTQSEYFQVLLPKLCEDILVKEERRSVAASEVMANYLSFEQKFSESVTRSVESLVARVDSLEVSNDSKEIVDRLIRKEVVHRHQIHAHLHENPIKAGYCLVKRGSIVKEWIPQYCVLTCDKYLDFYDINKLEISHSSINLKEASVLPLHKSLFNRDNCLQVSQYTLLTGREMVNLAFESDLEKNEWEHLLNVYCYCCSTCASSNSYSAEAECNMSVVDRDSCYRIVRSLDLNIMEAKDLFTDDVDHKPLKPFCWIQLGDMKIASSRVKDGDAPFWGEVFQFDCIRPHFASLKVMVGHLCPFDRVVEIGSVQIPLDYGTPDKRVEEWFQIRGKQEDGFLRGSIRISYRYQVDHVLPRQDYSSMLSLLTESKFRAFNILGMVAPSSARSLLGKKIVMVLLGKNLIVEGLSSILESDINATTDPNIIFRGNTLATKAMDSFMSFVGLDYLHSTLGPSIKEILQSDATCEVDPLRLDSAASGEKNLKNLMGNVSTMWEAILNSADRCPRVICEVFSALYSNVKGRWGHGASVKYAAISSFLFLRFFCPAILSPNLFGLTNEAPDANHSRTFTLIAKVLQNLANLSEFGQKEQYLEECNHFIRKETENMKTFIDKIACPDNNNCDRIDYGVQIDLAREAESLSQLFMSLTKDLESLRDNAQTLSSDVYVTERLLSDFRRLSNSHENFKPTRRESTVVSRTQRPSISSPSPVRKQVNPISLPVRFGSDFEVDDTSRSCTILGPSTDERRPASPLSPYKPALKMPERESSSPVHIRVGSYDALNTGFVNIINRSSEEFLSMHGTSSVSSLSPSLKVRGPEDTHEWYVGSHGRKTMWPSAKNTNQAVSDDDYGSPSQAKKLGVKNFLNFFHRRGSRDVLSASLDDSDVVTEAALRCIEEKGFNSLNPGVLTAESEAWDEARSTKSLDLSLNSTSQNNLQESRASSNSSVHSRASNDLLGKSVGPK